MMAHRYRRLVAAAGLLLLLTSGTFGARAQTPAPPVLPKIRVASAPADQVTVVLYALESGLFKKAGLDVEFNPMRSGAEVASALIGGSLDIGAAQIVLPIIAHSKNVPLTLVTPTVYYQVGRKDTGILVAAQGPIKTPKDLAGKTVGVSAADDVFALSVMKWLDQNGVDPLTGVKFLEIPVSSVGAAIQQDRIQAGFAYEPFLSNAVQNNGARVIAYTLDAFGYRSEPSAYFATTDWVSKHHDILEKFNRVVYDAAQYVSTHEDETIPLLSKFSGISPDVIAKLPRSNRALYLIPDQIQPYIDAAAKYKIIPKAFPAQELISSYALKPPR